MYILLALGILCFVLEILTPGIFLFFSIGVSFIVTSLFSLFIKDIFILSFILALLSLGMFILLKKSKFLNKKTDYKANVDNYSGKSGVVTKKMENNRYLIKVFGEEWIGISEKQLEKGDSVVIDKIDGTKLILK
ncbi:NfeD family protein [Haliovirga abyssi]|uniref:NfeD-like C-terminal domain-containing protein n=1 Tax=Haliovirga abyssi TaxID=2996794 RepID=A0AAU9DDL1_9FUSO|nr:NfeD family protein [Haliovirga abyssi]BDU50258.1 hypothetical protein HLVA_08270 [Haliovirga abyssi]